MMAVPRRPRVLACWLMAVLMLTACTQAGGRGTAPADQSSGSAPPRPSRTLVMISPGELPSFADKQILPSGAAVTTRMRGKEIVNAKLALRDDQGLPYPALAETLPQLNTDTWRVFPDGKMETTYRLRANLTWHDGKPLTADDFVFAYRIYATPEFGVARSGNFRLVEDVTAPDALTASPFLAILSPAFSLITDVCSRAPEPGSNGGARTASLPRREPIRRSGARNPRSRARDISRATWPRPFR